MTADSHPRAFGSDHAERGPDATLLLECPVGKTWLARKAGSQTRSEHPGTAVEWEGEVYEVIAVEALQGTAVRYRLAPWEHGHAIRRIERYDESSERGRHAARAEMHTDLGKRRLAILLSPLAGHLPGAVQKRMEHDFGASAALMTIVSALPLFAVGLIGLLAARIAGFGGARIAPDWMIEHQYVMAYLTVESSLRLVSAFVQGEPMGSLAGVLLYDAWGSLRARQTPAAPPRPAAAPTEPDRRLEDSYTMLEPLLALLSPDEQEALEKRFAFDPLRWGRRTSTFILFVAGANVLISVAAFRSGTDVFLDFAALVIGSLFIVEQLRRRKRIAQGHPAGSVLGALVRPLARPLLRAAGP